MMAIYVASEMTLKTDPNDNLIFLGLILTILFFINLIPTAAVGVRRLHDTNRSGWSYYIFLQMMSQKVKIGLDLNQKNKL